MITWNDLSYSLSPDGAVGPAGRGKGGTGATKSTWVTGLATIGGVVSRRRGLWHYRGHGGDPIPGELNELAPHRDSDYLVSRYLDWFDRHLKDESVAPAPEFSWFRDWISCEGNSEPAYATAPDLDAAAVLTGLPLGPGAHSVRSGPDANPEDAAAWTSEPLTSDLVQVGAPQVTLNVSGASAATAADAAVLFVTVYDLAPDGTATRVGNSVPTRVSSDTTVEVTVPAAVHRFEPGHRVQVTVAGGSRWFPQRTGATRGIRRRREPRTTSRSRRELNNRRVDGRRGVRSVSGGCQSDRRR